MKKKILFVTCTRADYGKLKSLILSIQKSNNFISKVFVSGMHTMQRYGSTYVELINDKIKEGWIPQGGIYIKKIGLENNYFQAMIKYETIKYN